MDPLTLGMLAVIGVAFYFLMIRPNKQRQKAHAAMLASLGPGARVMTTAGLFGTITDRGPEDLVHLEIAPGVVVTVVQAAIARVVEPATPEADTEPEASA